MGIVRQQQESELSRLRLWSVGHSNHDFEHFKGLLEHHRLDVVADVRSMPYSRYTDHFNREPLQAALRAAGIAYVFLGDSLGGRPTGGDFYDDDGHVLYGEVARAPWFEAGLGRLLAGAERYRVAMMCAEEDPTHCHRRLLVTRVLIERGVDVDHIRGDGGVIPERELDCGHQATLFENGDQELAWRSTRSVSRARAHATSSAF